MMKNKKAKIIAGSSVAAAAVIGLGAFALFTDNADGGIGSTAGTVGVELNDIDLENAGNINPGDHDEDTPKEYIPDPDDPLYEEDEKGNPIPVPVKTTPHNLTFTVNNTGNKSIRTRQSFIVSCKQMIDEEEVVLDPSVLSLMIEEGVELGSKDGLGKKVYVLEDLSEVAEVKEGDKVIALKYQLTPDIFEGVGDSAELEENATVKNVEGVAEKEYTYQLKMDLETPNKYQGSTINIDIVIEAMQYRNTGSADWELMTTKTVTGILTGIKQDTVPNETE